MVYKPGEKQPLRWAQPVPWERLQKNSVALSYLLKRQLARRPWLRFSPCETCGKHFDKWQPTHRFCKECAPDAASRHRCAEFGLTQPQYLQILKKQRNVCGICKGSPNGKYPIFHVDHCHRTNKVRGLLCFRCNSVLGWIDVNTNWIENAIHYYATDCSEE